MIPELVFTAFLALTGPDNQLIEVNPGEIVAIREPRKADHFPPGAHCLIFTSDGKHLAVQEPCKAVDKMLRQKE